MKKDLLQHSTASSSSNRTHWLINYVRSVQFEEELAVHGIRRHIASTLTDASQSEIFQSNMREKLWTLIIFPFFRAGSHIASAGLSISFENE